MARPTWPGGPADCLVGRIAGWEELGPVRLRSILGLGSCLSWALSSPRLSHGQKCWMAVAMLTPPRLSAIVPSQPQLPDWFTYSGLQWDPGRASPGRD